jgi:ribosomal protein S18 acetylase RimI-like enzyme
LVSPDPFRSVTKDDLEDLQLDIFLIKLYGKEAGEISIEMENRNGENVGIITSLAVLPEKRRMGLGSALALKAYEFLKHNNTNIVECKVGEENKPSYSFIKFIGFKKYDEEVVELNS